MKAIVQTGAESVEVQEREQPIPESDEVLIRVHSAGLCGSDAHAFLHDEGYQWTPIPRVMGHEYSGEVVETGQDVERFVSGDRITEAPIHPCGECFQCKSGEENVCQHTSITGMHRDGAYTDYVTVNERFLHHVPETVSLRHAAITEPTSIATRAVLHQSTTSPGNDVLVEGPGPIGTLVAAVAHSLGANVLVSGLDRDTEYRLPMLEELGVETVNVAATDLDDRTDSFTDSIGFDVVFDTTGHKSGTEIGVEQVRKGGQVVVVGLPETPSELLMSPMVRGEIDLNTSYGSQWHDFDQALRLLGNGTVDADQIIDTSFDTNDPETAFRAFLNSETCKPVFSFTGA